MQILLNLATRPYLNRRAINLWVLLVGLFLAAILLVNLVYALQNYRQMAQIDQKLNELNKQLSEVHGMPVEEFNPQAYAETMDRVALLNQVIDADHFQWTALFGRFETLLPDNVSIVAIQPNFKQKSLRIQAVAKTVTDMTLFIDRLLETTDFANVVLFQHADQETQLPDGQTQSQVSFSIEIKEAF